MGGDTFYNDEYDDQLEEGEFGDNLVAQTKRNKPEFIKYAKTAKRIDVKKLKENIWKTLTDCTDCVSRFSIIIINVIGFNKSPNFIAPRK